MLVKNLKIVNPLDGKSLDLYWDDVDDDIKNYIVYRMDIDTDPNTWVDIGVTEYPFFRDTSYNDRANYWYSVAYTNIIGEESDLCKPIVYTILTKQQRYSYVWHRNTVNKTQIAFKFTAEPIRVLFRNRTGKRCSCVESGWDAPKVCPKCNGTGYLSKSVFEFNPDGDVIARMYNAGETIDIQPFGSLQVNTPTMLALTLPILKSGDIIIRDHAADGRTKVYTVNDTHVKEHGANPGFVTFQRISLDEKGGTEILKTIISNEDFDELGL